MIAGLAEREALRERGARRIETARRGFTSTLVDDARTTFAAAVRERAIVEGFRHGFDWTGTHRACIGLVFVVDMVVIHAYELSASDDENGSGLDVQ
jgi:hypothetical protein